MSITYNVSSLVREPLGATRSYDVDARVLIDDPLPHSERVSGRVTLLRTNEGVLVTAHLRGERREACSRCVREVTVPVALVVEEEFYQTVDPRTGAPAPQPEDAEAFRIDAQHVLDLDEAVRQAWTSAAPMQPLCRPDCPGLCSRCGKDLNEGACACTTQEDERWSPLRQLVSERER